MKKKVASYQMVLFFAKDPNVSAEKILPGIETMRALPLTRVKGGFFSKYGYSVEDTDRLIAELDEAIMTALEGKKSQSFG